MGKRTLVLLVALILAGVSAFAIWNVLRDVEEEAREEVQPVPVFRATQFIPRGSQGVSVVEMFVESEDFAELRPDNAITTTEQLRDILTGRISTGPISQGQIVTTDLWEEPEQEVTGLAELIEPGKQAVSIRPDEVRAVGGFLKPGDRINIIASTDLDVGIILEALRTPGGRAVFFPNLQEQLGLDDAQMIELANAFPTSLQFTEFVMQDIEVLAVGALARGGPVPQQSAPEGEEETTTSDGGLEPVGSQVVTLEVTPTQAETLVFTQEFLNTWLTLVPAGFQPVETDGVTTEDVISLFDTFRQEIIQLGVLAESLGLGIVPAPGGGEVTSGG